MRSLLYGRDVSGSPVVFAAANGQLALSSTAGQLTPPQNSCSDGGAGDSCTAKLQNTAALPIIDTTGSRETKATVDVVKKFERKRSNDGHMLKEERGMRMMEKHQPTGEKNMTKFGNRSVMEENVATSVAEENRTVAVEKRLFGEKANSVVAKNSPVEVKNSPVVVKNSSVVEKNSLVVEKNSSVVEEVSFELEKNSPVVAKNSPVEEKDLVVDINGPVVDASSLAVEVSFELEMATSGESSLLVCDGSTPADEVESSEVKTSHADSCH